MKDFEKGDAVVLNGTGAHEISFDINGERSLLGTFIVTTKDPMVVVGIDEQKGCCYLMPMARATVPKHFKSAACVPFSEIEHCSSSVFYYERNDDGFRVDDYVRLKDRYGYLQFSGKVYKVIDIWTKMICLTEYGTEIYRYWERSDMFRRCEPDEIPLNIDELHEAAGNYMELKRTAERYEIMIDKIRDRLEFFRCEAIEYWEGDTTELFHIDKNYQIPYRYIRDGLVEALEKIKEDLRVLKKRLKVED